MASVDLYITLDMLVNTLSTFLLAILLYLSFDNKFS